MGGTSRLEIHRGKGYDSQPNALALNRPGGNGFWTVGHELKSAYRKNAQAPWVASNTIATYSYRPRIALDARGDAVAVWETWVEHSLFLWTAYKPAGKSWNMPVQLSPFELDGNEEGKWDVVMDRHGDAAVVWVTEAGIVPYRGGRFETAAVEAAVMPHGSGNWGPVERLSLPGAIVSANPSLVIDATGRVTVLWQEDDVPWDLRVASGLATVSSGAWEPSVVLSTATASDEETTQLATDPRGDLVAMWFRPIDYLANESRGCYGVLTAATLPSGTASWRSAVSLTSPQACPEDPKIALDSLGGVFAVWAESTKHNVTLQTTTGSAIDNRWNSPKTLTYITREEAPTCLGDCGRRPTGNAELAVGAHGNALVAWEQPGEGILAASSLRGERNWQRAAPLPTAIDSRCPSPIYLSQVGVDASGEAIAILGWEGCLQVDTRASLPLLRDAKLSRITFSGPSVARAGDAIQVNLSAPARIRVLLDRMVPGVRLAHHCETKPSKRLRKLPRRCTRILPVARRVTEVELRGNRDLSLFKLLRFRPKPGVYEALVTALDTKTHSAAVPLSFTIEP